MEEKYEDEEAKELRRLFSEKEKELNAAKTAAEEAKQTVEADYGPGDAFFKLKGECVELQLNQYKYTVCPYDKVEQDGTLLGKWHSWLEPHTTMQFKDGQNCWNIGAREAKVQFSCGLANKLIAAEEPGPCKYLMKVESPAACDATQAAELQKKHDEQLAAHTKEEL